MISGIKPYASMKDSGVDTLGPVPSDWKVTKLGHIGRLFKGNGGTKEDEVPTGIPCIRYGDLYTRHNYFIHESRACISEKRAGDYTPIEFGDILFAASGETIDEIGKSAVNLIQGKAHCGGDVIIFRPNGQLDCRFMGYATDFRPAAIQKARMGRGFTVIHIYGDQLKKLAVPLPPIQEQTDIVRFLDHMERRIQRYIGAKQRLIALLEDQKQIIIHQAVTGQIDVRSGRPYPAYKKAGVEWLGELPEHWEVPQLRRVAISRCDGPFGSGLKSAHYTETGIRVIRLQNIGHGEFIDSDKAFIPPEHYASLGDHSVVGGDVLIAGLGDDNHPVGRACIAPAEIAPAMVKADCFRFRLDPNRVHTAFVACQLTSTARAASAILSTGATRQRTNLQNTAARAIGLPTVAEQKNIAKYIADRTSAVNAARHAVERESALATEFHTRLISDVVTGKLDVRETMTMLEQVVNRSRQPTSQ